MKLLMSFLALILGLSVSAGQIEKLWPSLDKMPDRQNHQSAANSVAKDKRDYVVADHAEPYIEWCAAPAPDKAVGSCMILISGGGYDSWCDIDLVEQWRKTYTDAGCQCVILMYRTPRPRGKAYYQTAWEDGQRAVRLVRSEAVARGYDPERIGAVGMSAGSHLSLLLATSALTPAYAPVDNLDTSVPCHLNWAILFAPAYVLNDGLGYPNQLSGDSVGVKIDSCFQFDAKTCPMCMSHGGADPYSPLASTQIYRQLRRMNIPAEVHLYPDRGHGCFGIPRTVEFMRQMGYLGNLAPEEMLMSRYASDSGSKYEREWVWGDGASGHVIPCENPAQCLPYLEWYVPTNLTTTAIQMIYSGGSYQGNSPDGFEVAPARRYLNARGMTVVTLKYRTPRPEAPLAKHVTAWQDLQRAIRMVRAEAPKRGLDPNRIGIMGSSAGGHLTLMGATSSLHQSYDLSYLADGYPAGGKMWAVDAIDKLPCDVQWGIAIYPAYTLTDGAEGENTRWGNDDSARLVPDFSFDLKTCPMLFVHGDTDGWAAMNSVKAWEQLRRMGIQGEVHTLALRKHCFQQKASPGTGSYTYLDRIWEFLNSKKLLPPIKR